jgi:hypothetical protein
MLKKRKKNESFVIWVNVYAKVKNFYVTLANHPGVCNSLKGIMQSILYRHSIGDFDDLKRDYERVLSTGKFQVLYDNLGKKVSVQISITKELSDIYTRWAESPENLSRRKRIIELIFQRLAMGKFGELRADFKKMNEYLNPDIDLKDTADNNGVPGNDNVTFDEIKI